LIDGLEKGKRKEPLPNGTLRLNGEMELQAGYH
jgi:hypothetical protein